MRTIRPVRNWNTDLAIAAAVALLLGCQTPTWQQQESTNKPRKHVVVQFSDATLHPSVARVLPGGDVVWVNYSTQYVGSVVFPESIRNSFTCNDLRPIFMKVAAGYQSEPIKGEMENVVLPCSLKPGEYSYELHLYQATAFDSVSGMDDPNASLNGKIVVAPQ